MRRASLNMSFHWVSRHLYYKRRDVTDNYFNVVEGCQMATPLLNPNKLENNWMEREILKLYIINIIFYHRKSYARSIMKDANIFNASNNPRSQMVSPKMVHLDCVNYMGWIDVNSWEGMPMIFASFHRKRKWHLLSREKDYCIMPSA